MKVENDLQKITITGWEHAQEVLFVDAWDSRIKRFRPPYVYRRLEKPEYNLTTTLQRLGSGNDQWIPKLEYHLLRSLKKYAHRDIVEVDSDWHWLTMGQHHGLATRLLDWTYSPLVALHFATANKEHFNVSAKIWMVDMIKIHEELPKKLGEKLRNPSVHSFDIETLSKVVEKIE